MGTNEIAIVDLQAPHGASQAVGSQCGQCRAGYATQPFAKDAGLTAGDQNQSIISELLGAVLLGPVLLLLSPHIHTSRVGLLQGPIQSSAHLPVHCELPISLHGHRHPMQRAYKVGPIDGPQCEHAPLLIPGTKKDLSVATDTPLMKSAQSHPEADGWKPKGFPLPPSQLPQQLQFPAPVIHSPDSALPREGTNRFLPASLGLPSTPMSLHPRHTEKESSTRP